MAKIDDTEVAIDGNFVAHLQLVAVQFAAMLLVVHLQFNATHHADFSEAHCRHRRMGSGTAASRQEAVTVENHADVVGHRVRTHENDLGFGILLR